eukprot:c11142_g1_i2.p1 GENE.c11142_g1_i2~~c11142_g1_i2.p1  ORF type:complete len:135 (-),score=28.95 c11142_g1_i2:597-1001(-)
MSTQQSQGNNPSIYDLFARIVREQMDDDIQAGDTPDVYLLDAKVKEDMKREEDMQIMMEWLRTLEIPSADASLYTEKLRDKSITSLRLLFHASPAELHEIITKEAHHQVVIANLDKLRSLEHLPDFPNHVLWEW